MNRLILVRHGENLANLTLEFSHRLVDYRLTPKGVLQAQQTAAYFASRAVDEIYSSPLLRAVQTAEIIAAPLGLPVTVLEAFREVNVGRLEGQPPTRALWAEHNTVAAAWEAGRLEQSFPGGESGLALQARARQGFEEILAGKDGRRILVVAHGGIFSFGLLNQLQYTPEELALRAGQIPNCSITELDARLLEGRLEARLRVYAATGHLHGEAAELVPGLFMDNPAGGDAG